MLRPLLRLCFPAFTVVLLLSFANASAIAQEAQPPLDGPLLIPSAQVWQGPGQEIKRQALLLKKDGSVVLLGDAVDPAAFPEASVVEGAEDWILYPGFLHGEFPSGLGTPPSNAYRGTSSDPREGPIPAMEYGDHAPFAGHLFASDYADWNADAGDDWRERGFTSAMLLPKRGLLQGHASLVSLDGLPLGEALLQRHGPELLSLRGTGGYPQTPMAALAVQRQLLLDQQQLAEELSPDLVIDGNLIFRADSARAIENILDLQRDYGQHQGHWTILGGHGARDHSARLKQQGVGVLYRLDLEKEMKSEEDLKMDDGEQRPWWQEPLRLRDEKRRLENEILQEFLQLRDSGVNCALVLKAKPKDAFGQVQRLIEAGLDSEQAIAALTNQVAELLGVDGSRDGYFFSDGTFSFEKPRIPAVWNRGRLFRYELEEKSDDEEQAEETTDDGESQGGSIDGHWSMLVETPMGDEEFGILVNRASDSVEVYGLDDPESREAAAGVAFKGHDQVKFDFSVPEPEMDVTLFLKLTAGGLDGKMKTPFGDVPVTGERIGGEAKPESEEAPVVKKEQEETDNKQDPTPAEEEDATVATGHPQWPVEVEQDRIPHSEWAQERQASVLFRGGTLYRMDSNEPEVGDLLIVDGIIRGVGGTQIAPDGCAVVDAKGWHLMPGVIDAHSHLALDAINEGSVSISAATRVGDMIHPHDVGIFRAAAGGTAVVQALHGSANPIGGQAATWTLDYQQRSIAALLIPDAPRNIKFALGENVKQSNWAGSRGQRFPNSRLGVDAVYRRAFTAAQDYAEARRLAKAGDRPGFRRDVRLEVLADILDNVVHVQCHSYRADELLMFLEVCREFGIERPTFQHVLEGYKVAPEIAAAGAMASTFSDWWAYKYEVRDAIPWNVEILHKAGVIVSINSDSDEMIRRLNTEAGKAQRYGGLNWQEAMATCTLNSAKQLRLEDRLGSLEVGKDGTVTIYDAPPLSTYARCMMTLARGIALYEFDPAAEQRWADYAQATKAFAVAHAGETVTEEEATEQYAPTAAELAPWIRAGQGQAYWVSGATIHNPGEEPFVGTLHVKDGLIHQLYRGKTSMPRGLQNTTVVDASDMQLYPDFLDSLDRTGLIEIESLPATRDDEETGVDQPDLSAAVAIHADSAHHRVTRLNGIGYVLARPDFGRIRGRGALIQLDGTTTEDMIAVPDLGMFIRFPNTPRKIDPKKGPETADGVAELDQWFDRTEAYRDMLARFAAAGREPLHRDPRLEALLPCLDGRQKVFLEAEDAPTLMAARAWAKKRNLRPVYVGARDAWKVAGYFGADQAEFIVGTVHRLPRGANTPFDSPFRVPGILDASGCRVALSTNNPEVTRNLPYQAATASNWGWSRDRALAGMTIDAARVLGVDRFIGSIEEGKVASFFLTPGDPMDLETAIERMWIGGKEVELSSHQTELRERYLQRLPAASR